MAVAASAREGLVQGNSGLKRFDFVLAMAVVLGLAGACEAARAVYTKTGKGSDPGAVSFGPGDLDFLGGDEVGAGAGPGDAVVGVNSYLWSLARFVGHDLLHAACRCRPLGRRDHHGLVRAPRDPSRKDQDQSLYPASRSARGRTSCGCLPPTSGTLRRLGRCAVGQADGARPGRRDPRAGLAALVPSAPGSGRSLRPGGARHPIRAFGDHQNDLLRTPRPARQHDDLAPHCEAFGAGSPAFAASAEARSARHVPALPTQLGHRRPAPSG